MRVLFLNPTGRWGGAESSLVDVLASLRQAEPSWALHVVAASEGPLIERAAALGATAEVLPFPPDLARLGERGRTSSTAQSWRFAAEVARVAPSATRYRQALGRAIARFGPDVVHTNGLKMHLLGAWASRKPPLVWHLHDYLGPRPMTTRLLRWHHARCAAVIANSASVAADARRVLSNGMNVVVVRNAVDLSRFSTSGERADLDRLAGLTPAAPGTVRVGLVATFSRWKGHRTFLDAIARVPPQLPLRAYIIGAAVYHTDRSQYSLDELREAAASLGIADRVGFTGLVPRPETVFRALDVVVHASTAAEPFGLVIAEAMACGRAVIVANAGGAAELVTPGEDALAHAPGDAADLAVQIGKLLTDHELRARLGRMGRRTAERSFDRARLASELVPLYRTVVASSN